MKIVQFWIGVLGLRPKGKILRTKQQKTYFFPTQVPKLFATPLTLPLHPPPHTYTYVEPYGHSFFLFCSNNFQFFWVYWFLWRRLHWKHLLETKANLNGIHTLEIRKSQLKICQLEIVQVSNFDYFWNMKFHWKEAASVVSKQSWLLRHPDHEIDFWGCRSLFGFYSGYWSIYGKTPTFNESHSQFFNFYLYSVDLCQLKYFG